MAYITQTQRMLNFAARTLESLAEGLEAELHGKKLHPLEEEGVILACKVARTEAGRLRANAKSLEAK